MKAAPNLATANARTSASHGAKGRRRANSTSSMTTLRTSGVSPATTMPPTAAPNEAKASWRWASTNGASRRIQPGGLLLTTLSLRLALPGPSHDAPGDDREAHRHQGQDRVHQLEAEAAVVAEDVPYAGGPHPHRPHRKSPQHQRF